MKKLEDFESLSVDEIDHLWFPAEEEYERKVLKLKKKSSSKLLKKALNPFFYPIAVSRYLFGRRTRRRKAGEKSIISIYLFAFRKAAKRG